MDKYITSPSRLLIEDTSGAEVCQYVASNLRARLTARGRAKEGHCRDAFVSRRPAACKPLQVCGRVDKGVTRSLQVAWN